MIKIVFLLSLIYFISCSDCTQYTTNNGNPKKVKDCTSIKSDENKRCWFTEFKCLDPSLSDRNANQCNDFDINADLSKISADLEESGTIDCEMKVNIICSEDKERNNSSYLKIGVLLILGLLFWIII